MGESEQDRKSQYAAKAAEYAGNNTGSYRGNVLLQQLELLI